MNRYASQLLRLLDRVSAPETVSAMSPTTMLSVLEYSYFEPGVNSSGDLRTQSMISVGAT